jgi:spermine oxidase
LEYGAQWIHGTKSNPIYELTKLLNLVDDRRLKELSRHYFTQDGTIIDENFVDRIFDKIENIFDNLEDQIENELDEDSDQSLGSLLDQSFIRVLKKLKAQNDSLDMDLVKAIYRARLSEEKNDNSCDDLHRLSAVGWNEYEDFEGDEFCRLKYGYGRLVQYLASHIPKDRLILNELVKKIDYSSTNENYKSYDYKNRPITIKTFNKNANSHNTYTTSFAITTCSIGYLKQNHHSLFQPKLPLIKIKAIENLGFGIVDKVFVVFDKPVFNKDFDGMNILWKENLDFKLNESLQKWNIQVRFLF